MHVAIAMDAKPCSLNPSNKLEETDPCIDFPSRAASPRKHSRRGNDSIRYKLFSIAVGNSYILEFDMQVGYGRY